MIILNKKIKIKASNKFNTLYKCICDVCGKDRGYKPKNYSIKKCISCSQKNKTYYSREYFNSVHKNAFFDDYIANKKNIKKFRCSCITCGKDRGYQRIHDFNKDCKSCSNRKNKIGKVSPKKGIKTNLPAPNRGKYHDNVQKKILRDRMSRRLRHALARRKLSKRWLHIFDILGYSVEDLFAHLESKFQQGMTWDNYGQWHIDHIKPESLFNYSSFNDNEFKECWSLDNLQPLWAKDNLKKSNKYRSFYAEKC